MKTPNAKDLIKNLLEKSRKKRLGYTGDLAEILGHPFFNGIDLEAIVSKKLDPPYKPEIGDDLKYFDQKLTDRDDFAESVVDEKYLKLIKKNQHIF